MNDFEKYIEAVDDSLDLPKKKNNSLQIIENTHDYFIQNKELFKRIVPEYTDGTIPCGVFVSYGHRLYAARIGNNVELLTHQDGYNDSPIFSYRVDDILDSSIDTEVCEENEDNESSIASSMLLDWTINPQSNVDILSTILSKMIIPPIKRIRKSIIGNRPVINVLLPPFSRKFTSTENYEGEEESASFDFMQILEDPDFGNMKINFLDYSSLVDLEEDERKYLAVHHSDGKNEYLVFSVFERIRGNKECVGCVAINLISNEHFILQYYKQECELDEKGSLLSFKKNEDEMIQFLPLENRLPISDDVCSSFLGKHTTSFIDDEYILKSKIKTGNKEIDRIVSIFSGNKSMTIAEICAHYINEPNLYNIALGDMVYIAILLNQHQELFQPSTLKIECKDTISRVPNTEFVHFRSNMAPHLPANFAKIGWRLCRNRKVKIIPFHKISYKLSLKQIVESIIEHYDDCTIDDIIEDYLFIHTKNKKEALYNQPSVTSAAKMFIEMINIDSIAINFCNDFV